MTPTVPSVFCATAPEVETQGGRLWADCAAVRTTGAVNQEDAYRLWVLSADLVGLPIAVTSDNERTKASSGESIVYQ